MKKTLSLVLVLAIAAFSFLAMTGCIVPKEAVAKSGLTRSTFSQKLAGNTYDRLFAAIYSGNADRRASTPAPQKTKEKATEPLTAAKTQPPTEQKTNAATEKPTDAPTEAPTEAPTDATEDAQTQTDPPVVETPEELAYKELLYQQQWDAGYFLAIDNPDPYYTTPQVTLTDEDRYYAQRIVMGEAGTEGFTGCALVAQTLRDAMVFDGYQSIKDVKEGNGYDGWYDQPNIDAINAVAFIFDQNRSAVQHRILYFYGTYIESDWHESQNFVCQWGVSKFYDRWW